MGGRASEGCPHAEDALPTVRHCRRAAPAQHPESDDSAELEVGRADCPGSLAEEGENGIRYARHVLLRQPHRELLEGGSATRRGVRWRCGRANRGRGRERGSAPAASVGRDEIGTHLGSALTASTAPERTADGSVEHSANGAMSGPIACPIWSAVPG